MVQSILKANTSGFTAVYVVMLRYTYVPVRVKGQKDGVTELFVEHWRVQRLMDCLG